MQSFSFNVLLVVSLVAGVSSVAVGQSAVSPSPAFNNRVISSREGSVYVVNQNTLFRMQRDEGDVWERIAEDVEFASFDPRNDKIIYRVNTDNLATKSLDGGEKWISINNGLPRAKINFITVSPVNSDEVFAGTELGLYKTSDAGFSWEPTLLRSAILSFYINPMNLAIRYALMGDGSIVVSTNKGDTWTRSDTGLPSELIRERGKPPVRITVKVLKLFFIDHGKTYLLATTPGNGLFRSDDNGESWRRSDAGLNQSARFWLIYIGDSEVVIAGTAVARSNDGVNWTSLPILTTRFAPSAFEGIVRHPKSDGFLVLFRYPQDSQEGAARIGYLDKTGFLVGLNYGLLPRSNISSIWAGQFAGRRALFATVSNSTPTREGGARSVKNGTYYFVSGKYNVETGTYFSINDGFSWEYLLSSECGNAIAARRGNPKDLWMYGDGPCLLRLQGEGLSGVKALGTRFQAANDSVSKIVFDPVDKGLLYYAAGVNQNSLYRYRYNPTSNEGQSVDLNLSAADIVVCEDNPKLILAGVGKFSTDGGWTWVNKSAALQQYLTRNYGEGYRRGDLRLLSCRANEFRVLVYHYDSQLQSEAFWVMKSSDRGDTWEIASSYSGQLRRVSVNPDDSRNMFAVVQIFVKSGFSTRSDAIKVLETKDSGDTWQEIYSYKLTKDDEYNENKIVNVVRQVKVDSGRSLFVGGLIGLWRSDDEGKSWYRLGGIRYSYEKQAEVQKAILDAKPSLNADPESTPLGDNSSSVVEKAKTTRAQIADPVLRPNRSISGGELNRRAISLPRPDYPAEARTAKIAGTVTVQVTVDEMGNVIDAKAVSGHPLLHQVSVNAAFRARFSPITLRGEPVRVTGTLVYKFVVQ